MKELLEKLFLKAIELGDFEFSPEETESKWIGRPPTSVQEIDAAEKRLNQILPTDYKSLLAITNGYSELTIVEPAFLPIEEVDWLKNIDSNRIRISNENSTDKKETEQLERSIVVGGINEEQSFYLVPPNAEIGEWTYYKFSCWDPMGTFYSGIEEYLKDVISFMEKEIENNK